MRRLLIVVVILLPLGCREDAPKKDGGKDVQVKDGGVDVKIGQPDGNEKGTKEKPPEGSLAVLPFKTPGTLSPSGIACDALADTLNANVTRSLSGNPKLEVRAQAVASKMRNTDPSSAGKSLKVKYVLTGEVKSLGEEIVVNLELMEVENGRQLWGNVYREPFAEKKSLDKFEEKITKEVADAVTEKLGAKAKDGDKAEK